MTANILPTLIGENLAAASTKQTESRRPTLFNLVCSHLSCFCLCLKTFPAASPVQDTLDGVNPLPAKRVTIFSACYKVS
jgi:hypothetical protein